MREGARFAHYGRLLSCSSAFDGRHNLSWFLREDGLHKIHGNVEFDAVDAHSSTQNDSPLDSQFEVHNQYSGVLIKFLTFQTKKRLIK